MPKQPSRTVAFGVVMDPIAGIHAEKDTTLVLLEAAQRKGWGLVYLEQSDLFLHNGLAMGRVRDLRVALDRSNWYRLGEPYTVELGSLGAILLRKDPPLDLEYLYTCHVLEFAARAGTLVVNQPRGICVANEKIFAQEFSDCCPPTLVSRDAGRLATFLSRHRDTVIKPLDNMGGASVFRVQRNDVNASTLIKTMTRNSQRTVMLQALVPEYEEGDKRILLIDGEPVPRALLRVPRSGELCANLAAGGRGTVVELNDRDRFICERIAPRLAELGLLFAGIDVIGGQLTEINVTCPTCAREINNDAGLDIGLDVINAIEEKRSAARPEENAERP